MSLSPHSHPPFPLLSSPFSSFPFPISPLLIAYPFCFDTVAHSFASLFLLSSLKSTASALFVKKNPGWGYPCHSKNVPKGSFSNSVRHRSLHPVEKEQPSKNHHRHCRAGSEQNRAGRLPPPGDGPAKTVNHSRHGVEPVQPAPLYRHQRGRIRHRRREHPELDQKWNHVPHVTIQRIQR